MSCLFNSDIHDWPSWSKVFQSIEAFEPLVKHIFSLRNIPFSSIAKLKPGTNAVFRVGAYVIKYSLPKRAVWIRILIIKPNSSGWREQ